MRAIAVVGAGFSGSMVAAHLLRSEAPPGTEVLLFERSGHFGSGVAYGTISPLHLLNVPVGRMSAFADDADHFLRFARAERSDATGGDFVPRQVFGRYVAEILRDAERRGAERGVRLRRVETSIEAVHASGDGFVDLVAKEGSQFSASHVVLAVGNPAPPGLSSADDSGPCRHYVADPWSATAVGEGDDAPILLVGTGLTMLDVALALAARRPSTSMLAISRHGLLPRPHRVASSAPPTRAQPRDLGSWERTALGLLRAIRAEVRAAESRGVNWRETLTSLRGETASLWRSLPLRERARFLARLRAYWDAHRHRAAPATTDGVAKLMAAGRLQVKAARLLGYRHVPVEPAGSTKRSGRTLVEVRLQPRGSSRVELVRVSQVVNCTGSDTDLRRTRIPLLASLVASGLARPDPLGLGLDVDELGRVRDQSGEPQPRIFVVGPLARGRDWELTAVPELRVEAARVAAEIGKASER